jgi:GPI mannosyltransferase 3
MKSINFNQFNQNQVFRLALVLHILVPFFSTGFHHPDEYYYALDFAFSKLEMMSVFVPTWEHIEQIRPWSLPGIFYVLGLFLKALSIESPFIHALFFRLLSSITALYATTIFIREVKRRYASFEWKHLSWMMYLSFPILLFHARTSSENWSATFFLLALAFHFEGKKPALVGCLISLTFFLRFQLGFALLPFVLLRKFDWRFYLWLTLGFVTTSGFMIALDFWGYGEWTLSPYHYFRVNILEDKVNTFGTHPWYFYAYKTLTQMLPFWGAATLYAFTLSIKKFNQEKIYKEVLLLLGLFLLIHHLIGHKELRFIYLAFPLLLLPLALLMESWPKKVVKIFIWGNMLSLPFLFLPLYKPLMVYKYLYDRREEIQEVSYLSHHYPFELKAFMSQQLKVVSYEAKPKQYILTQGYKELDKIKMERNCQHLISTYPKFLIEKNPLGLLKRSSIWVLHFCD